MLLRPKDNELDEGVDPAGSLKPKLGLALGAGAARGWAHIGVLERLLEGGIVPDTVAGTSIGALVGGCYAAGHLESLKEFALGLTRRRVFSFLDVSWSGGGLISGGRLGDLLDEHLGELTFAELEVPFICIATELMTGHELWLRDGVVSKAMRASYALPGIFPPIMHKGQWLIDGAVVNPIPVSPCRALGARLVITVTLNSDAHGGTVIQHLPSNPHQTMDASSNGAVFRSSKLRNLVGSSQSPGLSTVVAAAFNISQDRLSRSRMAGDPPDANIVPRLSHIGLFDFDKAQESILQGRQAAERMLPQIEELLISHGDRVEQSK